VFIHTKPWKPRASTWAPKRHTLLLLVVD